MSKENKSIGVLSSNYAQERLRKPELKFRYKTRARIVFDSVKEFLGKTSNLKIVDYGAAEGLTMLEMDKLFPSSQLLGIEYAEDLIASAPALPENVSLIQGDVTKLPEEIESGSCDLVTALALLEHLPDPYKALTEAYRILRPGGIFVATCPAPMWDHISTTLGLLKDDQHEQEVNKKAFGSYIESAGLNFAGYRRFMWAPISFLPYFGVPVNPKFALTVDRILRACMIFAPMFVNQCAIGVKEPAK
jgi:ubiquinone/menaquinone biosynthesis C-methylase UbiE